MMEHTLSAVSRTLCENSFIDSVLERHIYSLQGARRKATVSPEALAKRWGIGLETARRTIERTTQMAVQDFHDSGGTWRLKHMYMQLQYHHLNCTMSTNTLFGPRPSSQKNIYVVKCSPPTLIGVSFIPLKQNAMHTWHLTSSMPTMVWQRPTPLTMP